MKATIFSLVLSLLAGSLLSGQEAPENTRKIDEIPAYHLAFENLPKEEREKYAEHKMRAEQFFRQKRTFECLDEIFNAAQVFDQDPSLWNLKGSCYVEFRAFDKAREAFRRSLSLQPDNVGIMFNIAEMDFVTKQWEAAAAKFKDFAAKIESEIKADELEGGALELHRLSEFKRIICLLKLDREKEALEIADKYDVLDDTPMFYYVKATLAYRDENSEEANKWLTSAIYVFGGLEQLTNWQDTIIEAGYIKSFYGGDSEDIDLGEGE